MKQYCLHLTNNLSEFKIYEYAGGSYTTNFTVGFGELANYIQADAKVFLFLPSNLIHAFVAVRREDEGLQQFEARFIAEHDDLIINNVSDNDFFFSQEKNLAVVISKNFLEQFNSELNQLGCSVAIHAEHHLQHQYAAESILSIEDRLVFAFADGTGFSCSHANAEQYLSVLQEEKENYTPTLLTEKEKQLQQILSGKSTLEPTTLEALHMHFFNNNSNIPNLFKFALSATTIFKKLNFSKFERALSLVILASLLFLPYVNIALLKNYEQQYKTATLEIFKSLNPDTRRVINAKLQMDQIINASSETIQVNPEINLSVLNYLDKIDLNTIKRSKVNFAESIVELDLDGLSAIKYTFFLKLIDRFDATIVEDRTQKLDGKISGTLILGLSND
jgi:hypothetical protein